MTITDIIGTLDDVEENLEEMTQIPSETMNSLKMKIDEINQILEEVSDEYGDEPEDFTDEEDYENED